jgi:pyrimidine operon attenuation protein/uracil phosphoribosyltransferase
MLNQETAERKIRRMALEIAERNAEKAELVIVGIRENGACIARKILEQLASVFSGTLIFVECTLNKRLPDLVEFNTELDWNNRSVILVDDVSNSGKTLLYALKPLLQKHPAQIETLVLVERSYKKFPIAIDYVGTTVATTHTDHIVVDVENDVVKGATLVRNAGHN